MDLYIVTGASSGLGKAVVDIALKDGHQVLAIARSPVGNHERLETLHQDFKDVCKLRAPLEAALQKIELSKFAAIHLINNAGVVEPVGPAQDLDDGAIIGNIEVNLTAPMILTTVFLKATRTFNGVRDIVNVSSGVAESPIAAWASYSSAKAGLRIYSHALAKEFASKKNLRVVSFGPGIMDTNMQGVIRSQPEEKFSDVKRFISYKSEGKLLPPETVAQGLVDLLKQSGAFPKVDISIQELI